jgi:hypothetical protein
MPSSVGRQSIDCISLPSLTCTLLWTNQKSSKSWHCSPDSRHNLHYRNVLCHVNECIIESTSWGIQLGKNIHMEGTAMCTCPTQFMWWICWPWMHHSKQTRMTHQSKSTEGQIRCVHNQNVNALVLLPVPTSLTGALWVILIILALLEVLFCGGSLTPFMRLTSYSWWNLVWCCAGPNRTYHFFCMDKVFLLPSSYAPAPIFFLEKIASGVKNFWNSSTMNMTMCYDSIQKSPRKDTYIGMCKKDKSDYSNNKNSNAPNNIKLCYFCIDPTKHVISHHNVACS